MNVGIVGAEAGKFTPESEARAREVIREIIIGAGQDAVVVSGRCPMGGVDVWAEVEARRLNVETLIFPPGVNRWLDAGEKRGFMSRNLQIAQNSDVVHCVVVRDYPPGYEATRRYGARSDGSPYCYHCKTEDHVKSGGCWTALRGKKRAWHVV